MESWGGRGRDRRRLCRSQGSSPWHRSTWHVLGRTLRASLLLFKAGLAQGHGAGARQDPLLLAFALVGVLLAVKVRLGRRAGHKQQYPVTYLAYL